MSVAVQATEAPVTTEAPPAPVATEQKTDAIDPKFAILAKRERAQRARDQSLKAREDALKAQEETYKSNYIPKDRLLKETMSVLNEHGISYDQLTNMMLNQPTQQDQTVSKLELKIAELEQKLTKHQSKFEENQTQAYDQAVNQIRVEAKTLIDSDPAFETIKETDNIEAVVELIKETYATDKIVISVQDAAKQVEDYLIEEAVKMAGLKKVKEKLTPQEQVEALKQPIKPGQTQLKTLTNNVSSATKPLSSKDRIERAKAAFRGELK